MPQIREITQIVPNTIGEQIKNQCQTNFQIAR